MLLEHFLTATVACSISAATGLRFKRMFAGASFFVAFALLFAPVDMVRPVYLLRHRPQHTGNANQGKKEEGDQEAPIAQVTFLLLFPLSEYSNHCTTHLY